MALEYLFYKGQVTAARRNSAFERVYDLPERVIPPAMLAAPRARPPRGARRMLVGHAASALGVGTAQCLAGLLPAGAGADASAAIDELVETGELVPVDDHGLEAPGLPAS